MSPQRCRASSRKESVQRHALRLLVHLHHRVAPSQLEALRKALEPTGQVGARPSLVCVSPAPLRGRVRSDLEVCSEEPRGLPQSHTLSPQSGEAVKELYSQLGEKLEQLEHRKPSPARAAETPALELPLPAVSAPAGL